MKKLFSFLAIVGIILASNCSRIPENNDPVIGIWSDVDVQTSPTSKSTFKREWIFNDVYLGRYHTYNDNEIVVITDFKWTIADGVYTIEYPGLENKLADKVYMVESPEAGTMLKDLDGNIIAVRE